MRFAVRPHRIIILIINEKEAKTIIALVHHLDATTIEQKKNNKNNKNDKSVSIPITLVVALSRLINICFYTFEQTRVFFSPFFGVRIYCFLKNSIPGHVKANILVR